MEGLTPSRREIKATIEKCKLKTHQADGVEAGDLLLDLQEARVILLLVPLQVVVGNISVDVAMRHHQRRVLARVLVLELVNPRERVGGNSQVVLGR